MGRSRVFAASASPTVAMNRTPSPTAGALAADTWLRQRVTSSPSLQRWHVEISLDTVDAPAPAEYEEATASRFHLDIYAEEWGVFFCHGGQSSWIRVTDVAFVHGRDDFGLLAAMPALRDIGSLLRNRERLHHVTFHRHHALVRTNVAGAEPAVRSWLATL